MRSTRRQPPCGRKLPCRWPWQPEGGRDDPAWARLPTRRRHLEDHTVCPNFLEKQMSRLSLVSVSMALCGVLMLPQAASAQQPKKPSGSQQAKSAATDVEAFNQATDSPVLRTGSQGAAVARAQILLDRAWYSTGEIDGKFAANMQRMVRAYQSAHGLKVTGTVTAETWQSLRDDGAPLLTKYTVTDKDAAGPFEKTPADMDERAKLKALPYETLEEALAEKFHSGQGWLKSLNAGRKLEAGSEIIVPNVGSASTDAGKPPANAASIQIVKSRNVLYVLNAKKLPIAAFPISIGNEKNDPLPIGAMAIKNEVRNPSFTYNPALLKNAPKDAAKVDVAPGPNNPVGNIWLGLTKPHWGIHGTPNPTNVGHSETNGCIHLTNWDAERLSTLAKAGFKVDVSP
ncbi:MAG: murein L,D-transpeptidase [Comamonadaceae bacterium]|nr:MAG: murein L,D-transpeptidase [Comamonadaceae bacterium]